MSKFKIEMVIEIEGTPSNAEQWLEWLTSLVSEGFSGAEDEAPVELIEAGMMWAGEPEWGVSLYLTDRAYGGREEGGWWYDCGYPVEGEETRWFHSEAAAIAAAKEWNKEIDETLNRDGANRDLSSVCCEGRYRAIVHEGEPEIYPKATPHYE